MEECIAGVVNRVVYTLCARRTTRHDHWVAMKLFNYFIFTISISSASSEVSVTFDAPVKLNLWLSFVWSWLCTVRVATNRRKKVYDDDEDDAHKHMVNIDPVNRIDLNGPTSHDDVDLVNCCNENGKTCNKCSNCCWYQLLPVSSEVYLYSVHTAHTSHDLFNGFLHLLIQRKALNHRM